MHPSLLMLPRMLTQLKVLLTRLFGKLRWRSPWRPIKLSLKIPRALSRRLLSKSHQRLMRSSRWTQLRTSSSSQRTRSSTRLRCQEPWMSPDSNQLRLFQSTPRKSGCQTRMISSKRTWNLGQLSQSWRLLCKTLPASQCCLMLPQRIWSRPMPRSFSSSRPLWRRLSPPSQRMRSRPSLSRSISLTRSRWSPRDSRTWGSREMRRRKSSTRRSRTLFKLGARSTTRRLRWRLCIRKLESTCQLWASEKYDHSLP